MAKYTVTNTCGHTSSVELVGPERDRTRRLDAMERTTCRDCGRATATATATAQAEVAGLPTRTGTEKQIAWAATIRAEKLAAITVERELFVATGKRQMVPAELIIVELTAFDMAARKVAGQVAAGWWIDHQRDTAITLLRAAV